jgi:hypothetical protein
MGLAMIFAAPVAEFAAARALNARGLGPVSLDVTRLDLGGLGLRRLSVLGGAASVNELDVTYDWRAAMQGRLDAVRIDGLNAKLTWSADGSISLGTLKLYPLPAPAAQPPPQTQPEKPAPAANTGPPLRALTVENASLMVSLPSGDIALPFNLNAAQDANGRALQFNLTGSGAGVDITASLDALEPANKTALGSAAFKAQIKSLDVPGLVTGLASDIDLNFSFDADGARTTDTRADLVLTLVDPSFISQVGLDGAKPLRLSLSGNNSRLFNASIDRTLPISRAALDVSLALVSGQAELRAFLKGWSDVPLANKAGDRSDPQDFSFERIGIAARNWPIAGGNVAASASLLDLKGPIAVAEGRVAADLNGTAPGIERLSGALASGFRLDGLSLSFDVKDLWVEAENVKLGAALAAGPNRAELSKGAGATQQINVVFSSTGGATLTTDLALSAALPKILTDASVPKPEVASVALPNLSLSGYLSQSNDDLKGRMGLTLTDGRLTHPIVGLADMSTRLGFDGKTLSGPLSASLLEAADPSRPRNLDRRGAELKSDVMIDSDSIDIKGKVLAGQNLEIGTFGYAQSGRKPGTVSLKIPPRSWATEPSFLQAFGPLLALTNTTGTFGLELTASPTAKKTIAGGVKLALADFGFTSGALSIQGLNAAVELDQLWPPRAKAPQRLSFGRLLAGVPFTDGEFTLALPGDGTAVLTQSDLKLAGGAVTGRDLLIPLDGRDETFAMDVANVDLGALVGTFATDGLAATGKLSGKLPLSLKDSALFIDRGRLGGRNGNIRYAPAVPPAALAQGGTILLQALADFRYDEIAVSMNGDITKDLAVNLALKGRNPGLYGGYPIEFNLNLDGPLNKLVREGLSGYRIPDDIKQRLEQMGVSSSGGG